MAVAVVLGGCALAPRPDSGPEVVEITGVPGFEVQARRDDCAAVALVSLLNHGGIRVAPDVVDRAVYDPRLGGSLLPDLEKFAAGAGAKPRSGRGDVAFLRQLLRSGRPVLAPIDIGWGLWRRPHYVVLYGAGDKTFLLHLRHGESIAMPATEFDRRWSNLGRLYLYLEP